MFIEEIILKKGGTLVEFSDGSVMCRVITDTGEKQVLRLAKDELIKAGVLAPLEPDDENDFVSEDSLLGVASIPLNKQDDSSACEETYDAEERNKPKKKSQTVEKENLKESSGWSQADTAALLDKYADYIDAVGPMKAFKNKKCMWEQISADFFTSNIDKSPSQSENRFKTIKKRKTTASINNNTSGAKRVRVEYEEEMRRIASIDDSIEPEILQSADKIIVNTQSKDVQSKPEQNKSKLADVLLRIHTENEASAKKRHEEKMEYLKNFAEYLKQQDSIR